MLSCNAAATPWCVAPIVDLWDMIWYGIVVVVVVGTTVLYITLIMSVPSVGLCDARYARHPRGTGDTVSFLQFQLSIILFIITLLLYAMYSILDFTNLEVMKL